jgi:hypothetical protein
MKLIKGMDFICGPITVPLIQFRTFSWLRITRSGFLCMMKFDWSLVQNLHSKTSCLRPWNKLFKRKKNGGYKLFQILSKESFRVMMKSRKQLRDLSSWTWLAITNQILSGFLLCSQLWNLIIDISVKATILLM